MAETQEIGMFIASSQNKMTNLGRMEEGRDLFNTDCLFFVTTQLETLNTTNK